MRHGIATAVLAVLLTGVGRAAESNLSGPFEMIVAPVGAKAANSRCSTARRTARTRIAA